MLKAKRGMGVDNATTLQSNTQSTSQSNRAPAESSQSNSQSNRAAAVCSLQEMFPAYGQGFLEACVTCFDGQVNNPLLSHSSDHYNNTTITH